MHTYTSIHISPISSVEIRLFNRHTVELQLNYGNSTELVYREGMESSKRSDTIHGKGMGGGEGGYKVKGSNSD